MRLFIYTFRTFRYKDELCIDFVFSKLKKDLILLGSLINKSMPVYIVGVAESRGKSKIETTTVNEFTRYRQIDRNGLSKYELYVPKKSCFNKAVSSTNSFCNWTMYKISEYIDKKNLKTKLIFIHINAADIPRLKEFLNSL